MHSELVYVLRTIVSFDKDDEDDWRVLLDCGHRRHLRHDPPRESRPDLVDPERRAAALGKRIECGRCRQRLLPEEAEVYKSTPIFTQETLPSGLLANHSLKAGVWGRVVVLEGSVAFCEGATREELTQGDSWTVLPEVVHHLELSGPVRLRVDFLRSARS